MCVVGLRAMGMGYRRGTASVSRNGPRRDAVVPVSTGGGEERWFLCITGWILHGRAARTQPSSASASFGPRVSIEPKAYGKCLIRELEERFAFTATMELASAPMPSESQPNPAGFGTISACLTRIPSSSAPPPIDTPRVIGWLWTT